jgi:hypothetical protein
MGGKRKGKFQASSLKLQRILKLQIGKGVAKHEFESLGQSDSDASTLKLGVWSFPEAWRLMLEASSRRLRETRPFTVNLAHAAVAAL